MIKSLESFKRCSFNMKSARKQWIQYSKILNMVNRTLQENKK